MQSTKQAVSGPKSDITVMPRFNKAIQIEVEIDSIYDKMLSLLPEDYKHREVLAHAIVGSSVEKGNISYVYSALNGFTNDIDFKVGDVIMCTEADRRERYDANIEDEAGLHYASPKAEVDSKPNWKSRKVAIGKCEIIEINLYASDKIKVTYTQDSYSGSGREEATAWVNHKNCSFVAKPESV